MQTLQLEDIVKLLEIHRSNEFAVEVADLPVSVRVRTVGVVAQVLDQNQIQVGRVQRYALLEHGRLHENAEGRLDVLSTTWEGCMMNRIGDEIEIISMKLDRWRNAWRAIGIRMRSKASRFSI